MAVNDRSIPPGLPQVVSGTDTHTPQIGAVRRDFLEAVVIALLAFAIGLALGAVLCINHNRQTHATEEQQWLN
jgi:hypothetical protein